MRRLDLYGRRAAAALCAALLLAAGCGDQEADGSAGTDKTAEIAGKTQTAAESQPETSDSAGSGDAELNTALELAGKYSEEDFAENWDGSVTAEIRLEGDTASVEGGAVTVKDGIVTITGAGNYRVAGTLEDGQLRVEAGKEDLVRVILDGAEISGSANAAIYAKQADKTVVILQEGTENILKGADVYQYEEENSEEPEAALFAKDDLTITGKGSLTVESGGEKGISTKDDLTITGGSIQVNAQKEGIKGRDSISVSGGDLTVASGEDGLKANYDQDAEQGWIVIDGGNLKITASGDGIQAESGLRVNGGNLEITAAGDLEEDSSSSKGLKSGTGLYLAGGTFQMDCTDDAIHTNGAALIEGGTYALKTGDDGVHADGNLEITGGVIEITDSYEGLEGANVRISGGEISLKSSDDGINAAGGDSSGSGGRPGLDRFKGGTDHEIRITGGSIYVDADGDGLDSNGDIVMTGGQVFIDGPESDGDGALDFDGSFQISGGLLAASGSSGMLQAPDSSSLQNSIVIYYNSIKAAGTETALRTASGEEVISFTSGKQSRSIVLSAPGLEEGNDYDLYIDEEKCCEITAESGVTAVSEDGSAVQTGGMGGFGGRGQGGRGGFPQNGEVPEGMSLPEGMEPPEDMSMPDGMEPPEDMSLPEGMTKPAGMERPEGTGRPEGGGFPGRDGGQKGDQETGGDSGDTL